MKRKFLTLSLTAALVLGMISPALAYAKEPEQTTESTPIQDSQENMSGKDSETSESTESTEKSDSKKDPETKDAETMQEASAEETEETKTDVKTGDKANPEEQAASEEVETQAQGTTIYVDGETADYGGIGDDSNSGLTEDKPVKTLKKAVELAGENGTVIVLRTVFIREATVLDNNVTVKRGGTCDVGMIYLGQSSLTINHATIDGNMAEYPTQGPLIAIYNSPTLTINDGAKLCNVANNVIWQTSTSGKSGPVVTIAGGEICNNDASKTNSKSMVKMDQSYGTLRITGGSIHDNIGMGVDVVLETFEMTGGEIYNNDSTSTGGSAGGIYCRNAQGVISGGRIYNNKSNYGGGVRVSGQGELILKDNALIENNTADYGGGAYVTYGKLNMQGGTIQNNTATKWGGAIFQWNQDAGTSNEKLKSRVAISGGKITGNTGKYGNGVTFYEDTGKGYPILELSGSPTIEDPILLNDNQDAEAKVSITGAFTPTQPVPIYDWNWTDNRVIVSYAAGLTARKADFVKYAKTSTQDIKVDGQDLQSINIQPQTFDVVFKEADGSKEYGTIQVEENGKIDPTKVPSAKKDGYTLAGWKNADGDWDFDNSTVTGKTELYPVWKLNSPKITLSKDKDHLHEDDGTEMTLTVEITDPKDSLTYTYKWYREGKVIDGAQDATLKTADSGAYKVEVTASDGNGSSDPVSKEIVVAKGYHTYSGEWKYDAKKHWKECDECKKEGREGDHDFGDWKIVAAKQSIVALAERERECVVCGYKETETIPDVTKYKVTYSFVSGTEGKDLPEAVKDLLPTDSGTYESGTKVSAQIPTQILVNVSGGKWVFSGYDADEKVIAGDTVFTGTWKYVKDSDENPDKPNPDNPSTPDQPNPKPDEPDSKPNQPDDASDKPNHVTQPSGKGDAAESSASSAADKSKKAKNPKTGDAASLAMHGLLLGISGAGVGAGALRRKKLRKKR